MLASAFFLLVLNLGSDCSADGSYYRWQQAMNGASKAAFREAVKRANGREAYEILNRHGSFEDDDGRIACDDGFSQHEVLHRLAEGAAMHLLPDSALVLLDHAIQLPGASASELAHLYSHRACLLRWPRPDEATADILKALELDPNNAELRILNASITSGYVAAAGIFRQLKKAKEVMKEVAIAVELAPDAPRVLNNAMTFYAGMPAAFGGDGRKALKLARELIAIDPDLGHFNMARAYLSLNRIKDAERHLHIALDQPGLTDPSALWYGSLLANVYVLRRRHDEAFEVLHDLRRRFPDYSMPLFWLGHTSVLSGERGREGIDHLKAFLRHPAALANPWTACLYESPTPFVHYLIGKLYDQLDEIEDARAHYEKALELAPHMEEARLALKRLP